MPFPPGLKIVSGDAEKRDPPATASSKTTPENVYPCYPGLVVVTKSCAGSPTGSLGRTDSAGAIHLPGRWGPGPVPPGSDGTKAGMQDPGNRGSGAVFPVTHCNDYGSPLRQDIHVPSCYNPVAGLDDYHNNTVFPTSQNNTLDYPAGWLHLPHLFYEVYYSTPSFASMWTPDGQHQSFVLSNGDRTGYSPHADFVSGWDNAPLQAIIDSCDAGTSGMDHYLDIPGGVDRGDTCRIPSMVPNPTEEWLTALPGDNPLTGR